MIIGLLACSKSIKPDVARFASGSFASVNWDGTIDVELTNWKDGNYIEEHRPGFPMSPV